MTKLVETDWPGYARAFSMLWVKRIYTGALFETLEYRQRQAVIAHEVGHLRGHHTEWRVICFLIAPFCAKKVFHWQEFQADAYAVKLGYGLEMLALLAGDYPGDFFSPSNADRRSRIELALRTISAKTTGAA